MQPPVMSAGFMLGVVIGFVAGVAFAVARRAWRDYRDTKARVPVLRKLAWAATYALLGKIGLVAVSLAAMFAAFVLDG